MCPVHSTYKHVKSRVRVGNGLSEELDVVVGVHQPASLNHCVRDSIQGVPYRLFQGATVCRILDQCRVHLGTRKLFRTAGKVEDMEIRDGEEGPVGEHGKDEDYVDWH